MGELITLSCPSCGGELEVNSKTSVLKCKYCSIEHLVRRDHGAVSLESYARCPICRRNDKVEKVTAILRSQPRASGLAISLAPPSRPSPLPRPEPLQKPETKPRPKFKRKPNPTPHPTFQYRKKNFSAIISGWILLIISYLLFFTFLSLSIELPGEGNGICSGIGFILFFLSIFLIHKGHKGKICQFDNILSLQEYLARTQKDPSKQKTRFSLFSKILLIFASMLIILSLLIFIDDLDVLVLSLGFSFFPAIFGFYFLIRLRSLKKQTDINFPSTEDFDLKIEKWKEENDLIQQNWKNENSKLLAEWIKENTMIEDQWKEENDRYYQEWEKNNRGIFQSYRNLMERWESLYFCYRDDVVFIPGEGTYAPVDQMKDYLQKNLK